MKNCNLNKVLSFLGSCGVDFSLSPLTFYRISNRTQMHKPLNLIIEGKESKIPLGDLESCAGHFTVLQSSTSG